MAEGDLHLVPMLLSYIDLMCAANYRSLCNANHIWYHLDTSCLDIVDSCKFIHTAYFSVTFKLKFRIRVVVNVPLWLIQLWKLHS